MYRLLSVTSGVPRLIFITLASGWLALPPTAQPQGCTESFCNLSNTAFGSVALAQVNNGSGNGNTALGAEALNQDSSGNNNTATGNSALHLNYAGSNNTATGYWALFYNNNNDPSNNANDNTATGAWALYSNVAGSNNTATGVSALYSNTAGTNNTAYGGSALQNNTTASNNTADGTFALFENMTGPKNTAVGVDALENNNSGGSNVAVGYLAGQKLTTGSNNIDIGANVIGAAGEANTIRIGKQGTQKATFIAGIYPTAVSGSTVVVSSTGKLGVASSSARFKDQIKPMDKASEGILALKPVTFHYAEEIDPDARPQFGLVAEDVEKVDPELVIHDDQGKPFSVRYEAVNAMLLNEFLKEHRKLERLEKDLHATITEQQKAIRALTAVVKEQAAQLQTVSAQLDLIKPALQMARKNP